LDARRQCVLRQARLAAPEHTLTRSEHPIVRACRRANERLNLPSEDYNALIDGLKTNSGKIVRNCPDGSISGIALEEETLPTVDGFTITRTITTCNILRERSMYANNAF
jgi:hypothetical protein